MSKEDLTEEKEKRMALTRKMLKAMGIEDEKIDQIIEAHTETVDALKADRDKYKEDAEKLPDVRKELEKVKEDAAKDDGKNPYKVKYEAMKEEFEDFKKDVKAKETRASKENAYRALLKDCGVSEKRINAVIKVTNFDKVELDEEGKIKDAGDHKKSIKEEWSDFIPTEGTMGAETSNPPANSGGGKITKEEIMKIKDDTKRHEAWVKYLSEN